jgi:hypothetical protein
LKEALPSWQAFGDGIPPETRPTRDPGSVSIRQARGSTMTASLKETLRERVAAATVQIAGKTGQGVLVPGHLILTAAQCITYGGDGRMGPGNRFVEDVRTADGSLLKVALEAVEPVSGIAALGTPESQTRSADYDEPDAFFERTAPVQIYWGDLEWSKPYAAYIYTHKREWLSAKVRRWGQTGQLISLDAARGIEFGSSGGPVVNESGQLLGVVSQGGGTDGQALLADPIPRPSLVLPIWIANRIRKAEEDTTR